MRQISTSLKSPGGSRPTPFGLYPEYKLEGTPIMVKSVLYRTAGIFDGKQYIVVAVSGGSYSGEYIAYALPEPNAPAPAAAPRGE
jgi:hypothetical protein